MSSTHLPSHDVLPPYGDHVKGEHRRKGFRDTVKQPFRKLRKTIHEKSASFHKTDHKSADNFTTNITEIEPPPTYDDCMKEVERLTQKSATNTELQQKIKEVVHQTTGSQDNLKGIHEKVNQFTANITRINSTFEDIRAKLHAVDRLELRNRKGKIWKGVPKWIGLRNEWRSLLEQSQDTARKSVTRCDDFLLFCEGVLKVESPDGQLYSDTIKELEHFTKTPDPAGRSHNPADVKEQATAHSHAFRQLKERLTDFKADFDDFAKYQETRPGCDPVIKDLNKRIQVIERGISFDVGMIMSFGVALKALTGFTTLAGGVVAAILGLNIEAVVALVTGAIVVIGEAPLGHFIDDQSKNEEQRDKLQNELLKRKETLKEGLESVRSTLEDPNDGLGFIFSQVDLLNNVWHTISHEADLIANRLTAAMDKQTLTYLQADIQAAKEAYKELREVLARYSSAT